MIRSTGVFLLYSTADKILFCVLGQVVVSFMLLDSSFACAAVFQSLFFSYGWPCLPLHAAFTVF